MPSLLNSLILLAMESETTLLCVRLYNEVVIDFNPFSLKRYFYRLLPPFFWPQIVEFKSVGRLYGDPLSF